MSSSSLQIELLSPPILAASSIDEKIVCTRPMREGRFQISTEKKNGKILVHCYGHGGAGVTTSFGSARQAVKLYEMQFAHAKAPIRIIGAGIMGLLAAIALHEKGYEVAGITAKELYDIPSWKNAGYFALVSTKTEIHEQENLHQIGMETFQEFKTIFEGKHAYISSTCIRPLPVYCSMDTEAGVEELEKKGIIPPREIVTLDFGNGTMHRDFYKFITFFMDTTRIMLQLQAKVKELGIPVEEKAITHFEELDEPVLFNCSGLGAKNLNADNHLIAVRGHLLHLNQHAGEGHMDYMIYTKFEKEYVYLFPKSLHVSRTQQKKIYGTLGGTFIPNTDLMTTEELEKLDRAEFQKLVVRTSQFFWGNS